MVSDRMQWHIAKVSFSYTYRLAVSNPVSLRRMLTKETTGRCSLPSLPDRLPLHAQLPARAKPRGDGRPDRVRGRRAARGLYARPGARVHAHDGPKRCAPESVHAADDHTGRGVR
jgi:hypothetical protein